MKGFSISLFFLGWGAGIGTDYRKIDRHFPLTLLRSSFHIVGMDTALIPKHITTILIEFNLLKTGQSNVGMADKFLYQLLGESGHRKDGKTS